MHLSLKLPDFDWVIPSNFKEQLFDHKYMLYYLSEDGYFNKTCKYYPSHPRVIESLNREVVISNYLSDVDSKNFGIPKWSLSKNGIPIISHQYIKDGDLLTYVMNNCERRIQIANDFLKTIKNILPILESRFIHFGDFSLENFMIEKDQSNNLKNIVLIDFGQSEIFLENKLYEWKYKAYNNVRPWLLHPDMFTKYQKNEYLERDVIYKRLIQKDMFVIGNLLYMILSGYELFTDDMIKHPDKKTSILTDIRASWTKNLPANSELSPIINILLGLLPINIEDMITPNHLYNFIDQIDKVKLKNDENRTECTSIKKRKIDEVYTNSTLEVA